MIQGAIIFSSSADRSETDILQVSRSTIGILFFNTPFREDLDQWIEGFVRILKESGVNEDKLTSLREDSIMLRTKLEPFLALSQGILVRGFVPDQVTGVKSREGYPIRQLRESFADHRSLSSSDKDYKKILSDLSEIWSTYTQRRDKKWKSFPGIDQSIVKFHPRHL